MVHCFLNGGSSTGKYDDVLVIQYYFQMCLSDTEILPLFGGWLPHFQVHNCTMILGLFKIIVEIQVVGALEVVNYCQNKNPHHYYIIGFLSDRNHDDFEINAFQCH